MLGKLLHRFGVTALFIVLTVEYAKYLFSPHLITNTFLKIHLIF